MELGEDVRDVCLDGSSPDHERLRDLAVGEAVRQQRQDLVLTLGQRPNGASPCGMPTIARTRAAGSMSFDR